MYEFLSIEIFANPILVVLTPSTSTSEFRELIFFEKLGYKHTQK